MANFDRRLPELDTELEKLRLHILEDERKLKQEIDRETFNRVQGRIHEYVRQREQWLSEALERNLKAESDAKATKQDNTWRRFLCERGNDAFQIFSELDKLVEKSRFGGIHQGLIRLFLNSTGEQESGFFKKLSGIPLAYYQGQLQEWRHDFEEQMESLSGKWNEQLKRDEGYDREMARITEEVLGVLKSSVKKLVDTEDKIKGVLEETAREGSKGGNYAERGNPEPTRDHATGVWLPIVAQLFEHLDNFKVTVTDKVERARRLLADEGTVVILFAGTRDDVKKFLEKSNLDKAIKDFERAGCDSRGIANECVTSGTREDALKFVEIGISQTKRLLDNFEKTYNAFIQRWQGIFVGPVGNTTIEQLLEQEAFERFRGDCNNCNVEAALKRLYDNVEPMHAIPFERLDAVHRKVLRDLFDPQIRKLKDKLSDSTFSERIKNLLELSRKVPMFEKLKSS
jgi:hypothetical protein